MLVQAFGMTSVVLKRDQRYVKGKVVRMYIDLFCLHAIITILSII
jgi:hypothetical protein